MARTKHGDFQNETRHMNACEHRSRVQSRGYSLEDGNTYGDPSYDFDTTAPHKATDSERALEAISYNTSQLHIRKPRSALDSADSSDVLASKRGLEEGVSHVSSATIQNARLVHGTGHFQSTHPNEDEHFVVSEEKFKAFGVLDGHGHSAQNVAKFARDKFRTFLETKSWLNVVRSSKDITEALTEFFRSVEADFFASIKDIVTEIESLIALIPPTMKSHDALLRYPDEVLGIQRLEPLISGGCTAVVAVVCGNKLYVANVGDSRAVLVYQTPNGALETLQLSTDHSVNNKEELKRLEKLGLDPEELKRAGRLGPQENTRSIGDYNIKGGYKSVDVLRFATSPPGIAEPSVRVVDLEASGTKGRAHYLILMSDGVYKSIEAQFNKVEFIDSNKVVAAMVEHCEHDCADFGKVALVTLNRLVRVHCDTFSRGSARAQACSRRDDMTLLVYKFV